MAGAQALRDDDMDPDHFSVAFFTCSVNLSSLSYPLVHTTSHTNHAAKH